MLKFFSALAVLLLAIFLQSLLAGAGWYFDLVLATLIAFAFMFDFWELLVFDLLAIFMLNWQPAPSTALIVFALVPLAAFGFRTFTHWHGWTGIAIAIVCGFLIFYIASAPVQFLGHLWRFFMDLAIGLIVGEAILSLLSS